MSALGEFYSCEHFDEDPESPQPCMNFKGKHSPTNYRQMLKGNDLELLETSQFAYLRDAKEGLLCMEIQASTYSFPLACAKPILHDIKPPTLFFTAPYQPEPTVDHFARPKYQSLAGHSLESLYGVPQALDIERLANLVSGRCSSAEDCIWMLKEDPAYFVDMYREWSEHKDHRPHKTCNCKDCGDHVAARALENAFGSFIYWDDIYRKLCTMPKLKVQMSRADESRVRHADEDCERWAVLMVVVWQMLVLPLKLLKVRLPNSPRLRNRYEWSEEVGRECDWVRRQFGIFAMPLTHLCRPYDPSPPIHNIEVTFFRAIGTQEQIWYNKVPGLVEEVQYMIDTDPEASQYIDE